MVDLCEDCRRFSTYHKKLKDIGENTPKTDNRPSDYIPQNGCKRGHKQRKNKDGRIVPFTHGYICNDFTAK